jgi:hypothetical protein
LGQIDVMLSPVGAVVEGGLERAVVEPPTYPLRPRAGVVLLGVDLCVVDVSWS